MLTWWLAAAGLAAPYEGPGPLEEPPLKNGLSFGMSVGMAMGAGVTLGLPMGDWGRVQVTGLPMALPDLGVGGSVGLRFQQYLGQNPRSRLYLVEGAGIHGWTGLGALWGAGLGMGIETRRDASSGRALWGDLTITVVGDQEGPIAVLPLPQLGIAWVF